MATWDGRSVSEVGLFAVAHNDHPSPIQLLQDATPTMRIFSFTKCLLHLYSRSSFFVLRSSFFVLRFPGSQASLVRQLDPIQGSIA